MSDIATLANGLNLTDAQLQTLINNLNTLQSSKLLELDSDIARIKEGTRLTQNGFDMLAKAVAGKKLTFTRVAFGDAIKNNVITVPTDEQIATMNALIHQRNINLPIADVRFAGNGTAVLQFVVDNSNLAEGFWAREIGVFAKDPDTNAEKLYSYKNLGALATYIPGGGGAVSLGLTVSLVTVIDQATNVTAVIDASLLNVSAADFTAHVNSATPHPNIPKKSAELSSSTFFWATGSDNQLHPVSAANLSAQVLGGNLNKLDAMQSRIAQTEINIANLYAQLDFAASTGLDANLLLAEDFIDCSTVDQFAVKVNDEVAGADNVCVDDVDGILEGHYYTISDGVRNQYVQVRSVARNDNLYVIFFTEPLAYTFNLKKTYLRRTTGLIVNGQLDGAGDIRDTTYNFGSTVWQGNSSSAAQTLTLATSLKNGANFTLSGDYGFTSDNSFTIAS